MKYFDMRGTNGHKKHIHRIGGLKPSTWKTINLICLPLIIPFLNAAVSYVPKTHFISPIPMNAYVVYAEGYKKPEVAAVSEREKNIGVIRAIWRRDWKVGVALARCESGLRSNAINLHNVDGSTDTGLFQVNSVHGIDKDTLLNPYANAGYAYSLYKEQGLNPWSSSSSCWKENI